MWRAPGTIVCATFALPARPPPFSSPVMSLGDMRNYVWIVSLLPPEKIKAIPALRRMPAHLSDLG